MVVTVGPFDTPRQSRSVIKTLDITQPHKIRYRNKCMPLVFVSADHKASEDIRRLEEPAIVGVTSTLYQDSTSYLLHVKRWSCGKL